MATPFAPASNVVSMSPVTNAAWPRALTLAWEPVQAALSKAWEQWAEASDDALFKRSERGDEAREFFEGMRLLRLGRQSIERDFWSRLRRHTDEWARSSLPVNRLSVQGPVSLSLVENDDLEETLAVAAMGESALRSAGSQWEALKTRLVHALDLGENAKPLPFAPLEIASSFRLSVDQLEGMTVPVRLVLLKLFERHAWDALSSAVTTANDGLRREGILPNLQAAAAITRSRGGGQASPPSDTSQDRNPTAAELRAFLDQVPQRDRQNQDMEATQSELVEILARLRPWANALPVPSQSVIDDATSTALSPDQWRHAVLDQLPASSRNKDHEQAIDLVALVFEFLLKDSVLPLQVQALLGRLQLPYLRVAVLDPHEFAQPHHPARQLLDTLTQTGQAWSEADDAAGQRFEALRVTVQTLLDSEDDDLDVFSRENEAWKLNLTQESKRQQQFEQRAVQTQEGQDRRMAAQRDVAQALTDRLNAVSLPPSLRGLINQHWGSVMTLLWLRHGPNSSEYRRGVFVLDQIKFVAQARRTEKGLDWASRMSAGLEKTLRQGWSLIGLDDATVDRMTHTVLAYVAERLGTPAPALPVSPGQALPSPIVFEEPTVPEVITPIVASTPAPEPPPAAEQKIVSELITGTWLEFEHQGATHRGKLSWISPFSGRLLIVSPKGLKVADLDPKDLANQMAIGQAKVLPDQSLTQRALAAREEIQTATENQ